VATGHGADQAVVMLPLTPASLDWLGASAQAAGDAAAPEPLRAEPAVATLAERLLGRPVELHTASQRALQAARGDWDLAQFDLASSGRTRALRKAGSAAGLLARAPQWRAARWAIGVLLVAQVVGLNVWAWQERRALAAKEAGVRSALTQTFPQVRAIVDAPVQMERELALLRQAAGSLSPADLEPVMAATGAALPDGQLPASLEYAGGELRLRGLDLDAAAIDTLNQRLMARGYLAREQNGLLQVRLEVQR